MAAEEEEMYLENLDEFVNDEDRIVTYKWLSRSLSVPANKAKQMLYAFVQKEKASKSASHLNITYIVGGRCSVEGEMVYRYVIAQDEKLEETKKNFSPVTSLHIYSVQKSRLKDSNALYAVDYDIQQQHKSQQNRWSHIYCSAAERLVDNGAGRGTDRKPSLTNGHDVVSTTGTKMVNGTSHSSKVSSHVKTEQKSKVNKKGQMSALEMFAAKSSTSKTDKNSSEKKKEAISADVKSEESTASKKNTESSKPGSMKSFFGKSTTGKKDSEKPSTTAKEKVIPPKKIETEVKQSQSADTKGKKKRESSSQDEEEPLTKEISKAVKLDSDEEKKPKENRKKQKKEEKKQSEAIKVNKAGKKKAVISESDEEQEEKPKKKRRKRMRELPKEESSDEEPSVAKPGTGVKLSSDQGSSRSKSPLPRQELPQQPEKETATRKRKRRRELRSKTYMNNEGFMVTEKVWESDSTDASEDEPQVLKPASDKPPSPGKKACKTNNMDALAKNKTAKQVSLTSFFKKS